MVRDANALEELAQTILRYVATRPQACDTVAGICDWWIPQQRYVEDRRDVVAALALLQARGLVECSTDTDGQALYCACRPLAAGGTA